MENNDHSKNEVKAGTILQKLLRFRVKIDKKGKTVLNISSISAIVCLILGWKLCLVGVVASLLLGYQVHFENEDDDDLEEKIRQVAQNVKAGAIGAAKSIQNELNKTKVQSAPDKPEAAPRKTAEEPVTKTAGEPEEKPAVKIAKAPKAAKKAEEEIPTNDELLRDLELHVNGGLESNPAATTFHSAYAASAGSVPVLRVEENPEGTPAAKGKAARGGTK